MGLLELENKPKEVEDYLLNMCQQTYWNMVEATNIKNLEDNDNADVINILFKLNYLYTKTPFSYFSNITIDKKMQEVEENMPDYLSARNILSTLLKQNNNEIEQYLNILDAYKVKIVVMLDNDNFYIPTEVHRNSEGFEEPVFLEIPMKELPTLKKVSFFKGLNPVNMYDFNDLVKFEKISCSSKSCYWVDTSLGFLVRMAVKYKQRNKLTCKRDFILDIYSKYILKVETIDSLTEEFLNSVDKKVISYYITKLTHNTKVKYIPFQHLYNIITMPFSSVKSPFTKRFLKFIKGIFNNKIFIDGLNRNIFNYVKRTQDEIAYNRLIDELPVLALVKDITIDINVFLIFTSEPKEYIEKLETKKTSALNLKCIIQLLKKKMKFLNR